MRPFRFQLERVLSVRRIEEERARSVFAAAERAAQTAEELVLRVRAHIDLAHRELERVIAQPQLDAPAVLAGQTAIESIARLLAPALERARQARVQAERERAAWEARRVAQRSLENLRGRELSAHRRDEEARENARIDEMALQRAERARRGSSRTPPPAEAGDAEH